MRTPFSRNETFEDNNFEGSIPDICAISAQTPQNYNLSPPIVGDCITAARNSFAVSCFIDSKVKYNGSAGKKDNSLKYYENPDAQKQDWNQNIPNLRELVLEISELKIHLNKLKERLNAPPITVYQFDCFTDDLLFSTLKLIFGEELSSFVDFKGVNLQDKDQVDLKSKGIIIISGSTYDTYDEYGKFFTENSVRPAVKRVLNDEEIRILAICFGHQSVVQALTNELLHTNGNIITTEKGRFQCGYYPLNFTNEKVAANLHLQNEQAAAIMTRTGYAKIDPKVAEYTRVIATQPGILYYEQDLVAMASFCDDRIVTSQAHFEALNRPEHLQRIEKFWKESIPGIQRSYHNRLIEAQNPHLPRIDRARSRGNGILSKKIKGDTGPAFIIPVLTAFARDLCTN